MNRGLREVGVPSTLALPGGRDEMSGFVKVLLQARGESLVHNRGQKVRLAAGDLTFLDGASRFTIELGSEYRQGRRARTATAVICLLGALEPPEATGSDSQRRLRRAR